MKKILLSLIASATAAIGAFAQTDYCSAVVYPDDSTVCIGDTVEIFAFANLVNGNQAFNFNNATMPPGWNAAGGTSFAEPCGQSLDATPYYWASTASTTPGITTAGFDVSCGGFIIFDMVFSVQSDPAPCEGPDLANEGVELQYSVNNGPFQPIAYFSPSGQILPQNPNTSGGVLPPGNITQFTSWDTYTIPIPVNALSTNTRFKWVQEASSSSANDNWGLDNIIINATGTPCGVTTNLEWFYGTGPASNFNTGLIGNVTSFEAVITQDTSFVVDVYDTLTPSAYHCSSDTISIYVHPDAMTYDLVDTVYSDCPTTYPEVSVTNFADGVAPYNVNWPQVPSTTQPTALPTGGNTYDTILYYVEITDGCGYERYDSTLLIVHQNLKVDSIQIGNTSGCSQDGYVSAYYSGELGTEDLNWSGPGPNSSNGIDGSAWGNLGPGWYYFTIEDDACIAKDSAYIEALNAPTAIITPNQTEGCVPLEIVFNNESTNADEGYTWDFGNGNSYDVSTNAAQTESFNASTTVTLIAHQSATCADTATVDVTVLPCGCTDPAALNYS
ncbi:hypothetical protein, partial [Lishizhenia sp.]|uniref:hypothetical protein n=1 Tax=Lishizhenia sp. TaxID=2497594 RepID=UPI00299EBDC5